MVRVLVASANRAPAGDPGGGGGQAAALAEEHVRAYLGTADFESECKQLASISKTYRDGWRGLLRMQLPEQTAQEFGQRLAALAGGKSGLAETVTAGIDDDTMDSELLADAMGVGESARRLEHVGPRTLASVAQAMAEEEAAEAARRELDERLETESASASATKSSAVGAQAQTQEEKPEVKVRYM